MMLYNRLPFQGEAPLLGKRRHDLRISGRRPAREIAGNLTECMFDEAIKKIFAAEASTAIERGSDVGNHASLEFQIPASRASGPRGGERLPDRPEHRVAPVGLYFPKFADALRVPFFRTVSFAPCKRISPMRNPSRGIGLFSSSLSFGPINAETTCPRAP